MLVYPGDGSAQTDVHAATQRRKMQVKHAVSPSQSADTGSTSPCTDPIMPGAWQGSHWTTNF